jgi:hypothetical protein
MDTESLFIDSLQLRSNAITYQVGQALAQLYPGRFIVEGASEAFGIEKFARSGGCSLEVMALPLAERETIWRGPGEGIGRRPLQARYTVTWDDQPLDVVVMHWRDDAGFGNDRRLHYFIVADTQQLAERFLEAVCEWNSELHNELMVFEAGCWSKDEDLFRDIQGSTLDNLVLRGHLKADILADIQGFFTARATYEEFGVPWKRGILFVGPPGNGKTYTVKGLVNALRQPCLYVKSFRAQMVPDEYNIHTVFERARMVAPCILVLEDLDSLITSENRSFFLNELDGFAANAGILSLATTNHPERLDASILNRPSRFDRKYTLDPPELEERAAYVQLWNESLRPALRLSPTFVDRLAGESAGFSFAHLKELFLSATMRWIAAAEPGSMDDLVMEQLELLREQITSPPVELPGGAETDPLTALMRGALPKGMMKRREQKQHDVFD